MSTPTGIALLEFWVRQAVANYGDDWAKIGADVNEKFNALDAAQRHMPFQ